MTGQTKTVSIELSLSLAERSEALTNRTGLSEETILRTAIFHGLDKVEQSIENLLVSSDQAVS